MRKIKFIKKLMLGVVFITAFFFNFLTVNATTTQATILATGGLRLRAGASTSTAALITIPYKTKVFIESTTTANNSGCTQNLWGKTSYGGKTGYICMYHVEVLNDPINPDPKPPASSGTYGEVKVNGVIRYGPSTDYSWSYKLLASHGDPSFYINKYVNDESNNGLCSTNKWAHVTYIRKTGEVIYGFMCTADIKTTTRKPLGPNPYIEVDEENEMSRMTDAEFDAYLTSQGFTEPYKVALKKLHKKHPTWIFKAVPAPYSFAYSVSREDDPNASRSLISRTGSNDGYLSTSGVSYNWETNTFIRKDAGNFYNANSQTIAYYMNPLNFLDERYIFYFEGIPYNPKLHNLEGVKSILKDTKMHQYSQIYLNAGIQNNVSPYYLATLSRQELGTGNGPAISGTAIAPSNCGGTNYSGYYNFFNIGAHSDPSCAVYNGLTYAKNAGWNSPQKAIMNGTVWIMNNGYGTKSLYAQKWDLTNFYKQYMQNIQAQIGPASRTYDSYLASGKINAQHQFEIPVFTDLTGPSKLPHAGNPNNYLNSLTVDGTNVPAFAGSKTDYTVTVAKSKTSVNIKASTVASTSSLSGAGKINLNSNTTTASVVVKAQNGNTKTYKITIKKEDSGNPIEPDLPVDPDLPNPPVDPDKPVISPKDTITKAGYKINNNYVNGFSFETKITDVEAKLKKQNPNASIAVTSRKKLKILATGDTISINNGAETKSYTVIIYGDTNGDGKINMLDLLAVQKHLNKDKILSNYYLRGADANRDNKYNMLDLLAMQKQILKVATINQK